MPGLALTLLVAWVFADDADNALAADNAAKFAERFNRGSDTHKKSGPVSGRGSRKS